MPWWVVAAAGALLLLLLLLLVVVIALCLSCSKARQEKRKKEAAENAEVAETNFFKPTEEEASKIESPQNTTAATPKSTKSNSAMEKKEKEKEKGKAKRRELKAQKRKLKKEKAALEKALEEKTEKTQESQSKGEKPKMLDIVYYEDPDSTLTNAPTRWRQSVGEASANKPIDPHQVVNILKEQWSEDQQQPISPDESLKSSKENSHVHQGPSFI